MNTLIVLLATISSLLANPKVQANPALLSEVSSLSQQANVLVEEYTAVSVTSTPVDNSNNNILSGATQEPEIWTCKNVYYPAGWALVDQNGNVSSTSVVYKTGLTVQGEIARGMSPCTQ